MIKLEKSPKIEPNPFAVIAEPETDESVYTPEKIITKAVRVQITTVSTKGPIIATKLSLTG